MHCLLEMETLVLLWFILRVDVVSTDLGTKKTLPISYSFLFSFLESVSDASFSELGLLVCQVRDYG